MQILYTDYIRESYYNQHSVFLLYDNTYLLIDSDESFICIKTNLPMTSYSINLTTMAKFLDKCKILILILKKIAFQKTFKH